MRSFEMWTYIDGVKINVPLDTYDAIHYGWHKGAEFRQWEVGVDVLPEQIRENEIRQWANHTFRKDTFKFFYNGVWFFREEDAILCQLKWE